MGLRLHQNHAGPGEQCQPADASRVASQGGRPILFTCPPRTQEVWNHRPFLATSDPACLEPAACPQGGVFYGTGSGGVALSKMEIAAHGQKVVFTT